MPLASVLLPPTCLRNTTSKPALLTEAQRKARTEHNHIRQDKINEAVEEWKQTTLTTAADLSERFGMKPHHFLNLFFQDGAHLVHKHSKVNAYNAYLHMKAEELRDNGENPTLAKLHSEEFKTEYNNLGEDELEEIITRHTESSSATYQQRVTARARVQDVAHTFKTMQQMVRPSMRIGVEGFICLVRNSPEYHMEPKWYFSNQALVDYMRVAVPVHKGWDIGYVSAKLEAFAIAGCNSINLRQTSKQRGWDIGYVSAKLEAFAIAGCNSINLRQTSKQRADEMKRQIREKICTMLVEITNNETAVMHYIDYKEKIVQRYGVELIGWTYNKFTNPSILSTSLPALQVLLDPINTGSWKFIWLTPLQLNERCQEHQKAIDNGSIPAPKTRKPRKDRGTKRKLINEPGKENENSNALPKSKKRCTSAAKKKVLGDLVQPKSTETVDSEGSSKD
ncbi:hypothetical protein CVT25_015918 [Psilocybe cyanescens]|uniref:Uncharacterized protein n=1 Tax=Psilocybe cyanescens TaxID=93625 RepID=A0A409WSD9_PSICY|nr:hypothetical protein CVT25_015918 [Psilocybe cyanescens]